MSPKYYKEVNEKRKILREIYGGMMTLKQLSRELAGPARKWVQEHALQGVRLGKSVRYETDQVARVIVDGRGMV